MEETTVTSIKRKKNILSFPRLKRRSCFSCVQTWLGSGGGLVLIHLGHRGGVSDDALRSCSHSTGGQRGFSSECQTRSQPLTPGGDPGWQGLLLVFFRKPRVLSLQLFCAYWEPDCSGASLYPRCVLCYDSAPLPLY